MFAQLLEKTKKEEANLVIFKAMVAEQKKQKDEEDKRQETAFYEDFELELFDAEKQQKERKTQLATGTAFHRIPSRNKQRTQRQIQSLVPQERIVNKWSPEDVAALRENIRQVGLNINFLHILMPERTQNAIKARIRLENPHEITELARQCREIPEHVRQVYAQLGRRHGALDLDLDLSEYEHQREEQAGMAEEVRDLVGEFEGW
ncbi:hypothetical protein SS50377_22600 [Spironucleus salmonicida]|uniref:Uncharacterized protein n=2 Tax=Spironucleus salmonicida TaxID=348837 RepID=V6LDZ3_9EUKA|nr:hypothetical protein SS50377_22588 [Spironucleus salmonicida]KAH0574983.1 hypothetical protein SS50377_22600 [Spironucleus salmonicida]|eukprot:EST41911.1 Hypothetical protein SS50377_18215 [Spironucleus salmonicida]